MKGMAPETYLAFTIIIIFIVLGSLVTNIFFATKTVDLEFTKDTYALVNALKAAKVYDEASLDFSVYQAVYNNSRYGGYYDISQVVNKMTNELYPKCKVIMDKFINCSNTTGKEAGGKIHTGLKWEGTKYFDTYPVGLLQCILSRLRREDNGQIYYGLKWDQITQLDCDFKDVTESALKGFQKDHGLSETGVVDSATLKKLEEVFVSKWGDCSKFFDGCQDNIRYMIPWERTGTSVNPDENKIISELKAAIINEMGKYTKTDYNFMEQYVKLPVYKTQGIEVKKGTGFLNISLKSDEPISVTKEDRKLLERINLRMSPNISKEYPIRYLDLYAAAVTAFQEVIDKAKEKNCDEYIGGDKIKHKEQITGFVIDAEVFDKIEAPCQLIVKVSVKDTIRPFPVFNSTDVAFETVSLEYLVRVV
jgi:hypothetical protein